MGGGSLHSFVAKLQYSRGQRETNDIETLRALIPGCVSVVKTDAKTDRLGVDYIATLRKGTEILIDAKTRDAGASRYWSTGPELALEIWSVMPGGKYRTPDGQSKVGWTLAEDKQTDMIFYTFHPSDSTETFLIPFQHLRMAFRQSWPMWSKVYRRKTQDSFKWQSESIFVPANVVLRAIDSVTRCHITREFL